MELAFLPFAPTIYCIQHKVSTQCLLCIGMKCFHLIQSCLVCWLRYPKFRWASSVHREHIYGTEPEMLAAIFCADICTKCKLVEAFDWTVFPWNAHWRKQCPGYWFCFDNLCPVRPVEHILLQRKRMQVTGLGRTEHGLVECRRMVVARPGQGTGWEGIEYTAMHSVHAWSYHSHQKNMIWYIRYMLME